MLATTPGAMAVAAAGLNMRQCRLPVFAAAALNGAHCNCLPAAVATGPRVAVMLLMSIGVAVDSKNSSAAGPGVSARLSAILMVEPGRAVAGPVRLKLFPGGVWARNPSRPHQARASASRMKKRFMVQVSANLARRGSKVEMNREYSCAAAGTGPEWLHETY